MSYWGIHSSFSTDQMLRLLFQGGWPALSLIALFWLKGQKREFSIQASWVLIGVAIPLLGPMAYWIVHAAGNIV